MSVWAWVTAAVSALVIGYHVSVGNVRGIRAARWVTWCVLLILALKQLDPGPMNPWLAILLGTASLLLVGDAVRITWSRGTVPRISSATLLPELAGAFALVTLVVIIFGFSARYIGWGTKMAPATITNPLDTAQFSQVLRYAQSLDWDSLDVSKHTYDEGFLITKDSQGNPVAGPHARIIPERNAYLISHTGLFAFIPWDQKHRTSLHGHIIARVWVDPAYRGPGAPGYPKLGYGPGLNYIWMDSLRYDPAADVMRARRIVFHQDGTTFVDDSAKYYHHLNRWANYSRARFLFDPNDDCEWIACSTHGCMETCGS